MADLFSSPAPATAFDDGKAPDALRTIGEVAKALGLRQHVLRYWEEQFPMLKPLKRSGGRRYYRPEDIALVETIDRLVHREGFTLKGARKVLSARGEGGGEPSGQGGQPPPVAAPTSASPTVRLRLVGLRNRLAEALQQS
jgi:DNA-binding transcriptional MerR regulator